MLLTVVLWVFMMDYTRGDYICLKKRIGGGWVSSDQSEFFSDIWIFYLDKTPNHGDLCDFYVAVVF